jgi:hypothetical protein
VISMGPVVALTPIFATLSFCIKTATSWMSCRKTGVVFESTLPNLNACRQLTSPIRSPPAFSHAPLSNPQKPRKAKQLASLPNVRSIKPQGNGLVEHCDKIEELIRKRFVCLGAVVTAEGLRCWLLERLMMRCLSWISS